MLSMDCDHFPGEVLKVDDEGSRVIVEAEWRNITAAETSGVTFAAVENTSIEDMRSALSAARGAITPGKPKNDRHQKPAGTVRRRDRRRGVRGVRCADGRRWPRPRPSLQPSARCQPGSVPRLRHTPRRALPRSRPTPTPQRPPKSRRSQRCASARLTAACGRPMTSAPSCFDDLAKISTERATQFVESLEPILPIRVPMQSGTAGAPKRGGSDEFAECPAQRVRPGERSISPSSGTSSSSWASRRPTLINHGQHTREES